MKTFKLLAVVALTLSPITDSFAEGMSPLLEQSLQKNIDVRTIDSEKITPDLKGLSGVPPSEKDI